MTEKLMHTFVSVEPFVEPEDATWRKLETAGDIVLSPKLRARLRNAMEFAWSWGQVERAGVVPSRVRLVLKKLTGALERLEAVVHAVYLGSSRENLEALGQIQAAMKPKSYADMRQEFRALLAVLQWWRASVTAAVDSLSSEGGRPYAPSIGRFVRVAYMIFVAAGGRTFPAKVHRTKALEFVAAACKMVGYWVPSEPTLAKTLRTSLQEIGCRLPALRSRQKPHRKPRS